MAKIKVRLTEQQIVLIDKLRRQEQADVPLEKAMIEFLRQYARQVLGREYMQQ